MIGQWLLHYQILEKLGEGGMGVVHTERDTVTGTALVKVLDLGLANLTETRAGTAGTLEIRTEEVSR
jgi:hypothetical protein